MILKGQNIFLRYPSKIDIDLMMKWENDPITWESGDNKEPYNKQEVTDFIKDGQDINVNKQLRFMICINENERPVGCVDLYDYNEENERAGVGILIYDKEDRKKGFASESLFLLNDYSKNDLNLKQLFCYILEDNENSIRLFKKVGFIKTGLKKNWRKQGNIWKDELIMQLLFR